VAYDLNKLADAINEFPAETTMFRHGKKTWKRASYEDSLHNGYLCGWKGSLSALHNPAALLRF
jgi:hypothetical protein